MDNQDLYGELLTLPHDKWLNYIRELNTDHKLLLPFEEGHVFTGEEHHLVVRQTRAGKHLISMCFIIIDFLLKILDSQDNTKDADRREAEEILRNVDWQMDNFLPAEGESSSDCKRRRLTDAIAEALSARAPRLVQEEDDNDGWEAFCDALTRNVKDYSEKIDGKFRYAENGISSITLSHKEWRDVHQHFLSKVES